MANDYRKKKHPRIKQSTQFCDKTVDTHKITIYSLKYCEQSISPSFEANDATSHYSFINVTIEQKRTSKKESLKKIEKL